jgi:hypothetical protein
MVQRSWHPKLEAGVTHPHTYLATPAASAQSLHHLGIGSEWEDLTLFAQKKVQLREPRAKLHTVS